MVPPNFNNHEDYREAVCCCCGIKTAKKRISVKEEALVVEFAKKEYNSKVQSHPAGLCTNCRRRLFQCANVKKNKMDLDLDEKQVGLGIFCEQTCESSHCGLKPTMQRFKRKVDQRDQGLACLEQLVISQARLFSWSMIPFLQQ